MIEVYELLRRKENELARVRREIEALRTVTALLSEPDDIAALQPGPDPNIAPVLFGAFLAQENVLHDTSSPESDEVLLRSIPPNQSRLLDWLGRALGEWRKLATSPDLNN